MADDQKKIIPINYTNREFSEIKSDLVEIAQRFYPDTFQDFSEGSFGSLIIDAVAYVGDQLSFYLDYNVNESFLDTANQFNNVVRHGNVLGYKYSGQSSTYGEVSVFVLVPASATGIGPDKRYMPILRRGTTFSAQNNSSYILTENVDFANPQNDVVVARVNDATGAPTYYAVKAAGTVVSGRYGTETISVGPFERFKKIKLRNSNVAEIISVIDKEGNEYFEVDYLSQDFVHREISNSNYKSDHVPSILKPVLISRKFVLQLAANSAILQFGNGKSSETSAAATPASLALDLFGKDYVVDSSFDPTKLSKNENFGIVPSNTQLTITYRTNNPSNSNISTGGLNKKANVLMNFTNEQRLGAGTIRTVRSSLEVFNDKPIIDSVSTLNSEEVKRRIFDTFATQNRAVTQSDYESVAMRMPAKFGSIKRVSVMKDMDSLKRNLNMYIISEAPNGKLIKTNQTIKNNLKTWLQSYRMINDTIDILDPFIINLGIEFVIRTNSGANKYDVLSNSMNVLAAKYLNPLYIGESFLISDVYQTLKEVEGVLDVTKVKIVNKKGANYSGNVIVINDNLSPEGNELVCPKNAIFEIKHPSVDIIGRLK